MKDPREVVVAFGVVALCGVAVGSALIDGLSGLLATPAHAAVLPDSGENEKAMRSVAASDAPPRNDNDTYYRAMIRNCALCHAPSAESAGKSVPQARALEQLAEERGKQLVAQVLSGVCPTTGRAPAASVSAFQYAEDRITYAMARLGTL